MSKRKPASDCGPPCALLNERQHAFHLECLKIQLPEKMTLGDAYKNSGYSRSGSRNTIDSAASKLYGSDKIQAAMSWHRGKAAKRAQKSKDDAIADFEGVVDLQAKEAPSHGERLRALEALAKIHGWNEPQKVSIEWDDLAKRAKDGDPEAMAELRKIADGGG